MFRYSFFFGFNGPRFLLAKNFPELGAFRASIPLPRPNMVPELQQDAKPVESLVSSRFTLVFDLLGDV